MEIDKRKLVFNLLTTFLIVIICLNIGMLISFSTFISLPGDPIYALLEASGIQSPLPDQVAALRSRYGLDQPIIIQYIRNTFNMLSGNWGQSISLAPQTPVWELITLRLPRTIDLIILPGILMVILGIVIVLLRRKNLLKKRRPVLNKIVQILSIFGMALPIFFLGMFLQYTLAYQLELFPATYYKDLEIDDPPFITGFYVLDAIFAGQFWKIGDYLYHLVLPVFCLAFVTIAGILRQTRSSMLEVLEQDYVRTARAKGCKERTVIHTHALKNALIPTVTVIGLGFAGLLAGAVLTETTFNLNGMGSLLVEAIGLVDYWVINATVFIISIIFVLATLIVDLLYGILDPRIRY